MAISSFDQKLIDEVAFLLKRLTSLGSPVGPPVDVEKLSEWNRRDLLGLIYKLKRMVVILAGPKGLQEEFLFPSVWLAKAESDRKIWPDGWP